MTQVSGIGPGPFPQSPVPQPGFRPKVGSSRQHGGDEQRNPVVELSRQQRFCYLVDGILSVSDITQTEAWLRQELRQRLLEGILLNSVRKRFASHRPDMLTAVDDLLRQIGRERDVLRRMFDDVRVGNLPDQMSPYHRRRRIFVTFVRNSLARGPDHARPIIGTMLEARLCNMEGLHDEIRLVRNSEPQGEVPEDRINLKGRLDNSSEEYEILIEAMKEIERMERLEALLRRLDAVRTEPSEREKRFEAFIADIGNVDRGYAGRLLKAMASCRDVEHDSLCREIRRLKEPGNRTQESARQIGRLEALKFQVLKEIQQISRVANGRRGTEG